MVNEEKMQTVDVVSSYLNLYVSVLNAYQSGEKLPDYDWNHLMYIALGRVTVPQDLKNRASRIMKEHKDLEWKICREVYPDTDKLLKDLNGVGQSSPFAMFLMAYNNKLMDEEIDEIGKKIENLKRSTYLNNYITIWEEIVNIQKEYLVSLNIRS